jgi:hypothetical protein
MVMPAAPRIGSALYRPVRVVTCPAISEVIITPTIMGVSSRPLTVGEAPCTVCWYSGRKVIAPNMARPARKLSPLTSANRALILDCYSQIVGRRLGVLRFLEQNQAAVHHLMTEGAQDRKKLFRTQFETLRDLLAGPDAPLRDRVRASVAVVSVGVSCMLFEKDSGAQAELHDIVLETACELAGVKPPAG